MKSLSCALLLAAAMCNFSAFSTASTLRGSAAGAVHLAEENTASDPVFPSSPIIQTRFGPVRGYLKDGVFVFLGIPFGKGFMLS
jgi:hypothetical protein